MTTRSATGRAGAADRGADRVSGGPGGPAPQVEGSGQPSTDELADTGPGGAPPPAGGVRSPLNLHRDLSALETRFDALEAAFRASASTAARGQERTDSSLAQLHRLVSALAGGRPPGPPGPPPGPAQGQTDGPSAPEALEAADGATTGGGAADAAGAERRVENPPPNPRTDAGSASQRPDAAARAAAASAAAAAAATAAAASAGAAAARTAPLTDADDGFNDPEDPPLDDRDYDYLLGIGVVENTEFARGAPDAPPFLLHQPAEDLTAQARDLRAAGLRPQPAVISNHDALANLQIPLLQALSTRDGGARAAHEARSCVLPVLLYTDEARATVAHLLQDLESFFLHGLAGRAMLRVALQALLDHLTGIFRIVAAREGTLLGFARNYGPDMLEQLARAAPGAKPTPQALPEQQSLFQRVADESARVSVTEMVAAAARGHRQSAAGRASGGYGARRTARSGAGYTRGAGSAAPSRSSSPRRSSGGRGARGISRRGEGPSDLGDHGGRDDRERARERDRDDAGGADRDRDDRSVGSFRGSRGGRGSQRRGGGRDRARGADVGGGSGNAATAAA